MLGGDQSQVGIGRECRMIIRRKRDQRIILGLYQKSGHADLVQELIGRLSGVIIVGASKAERMGREAVIEIEDIPDLIEALQVEDAGSEPLFQADALLQASDKPSGVDDVGWMAEPPGAGCQIDGR